MNKLQVIRKNISIINIGKKFKKKKIRTRYCFITNINFINKF